MTGSKGWAVHVSRGALSKLWRKALVAAALGMSIGVASCGGSSSGPPIVFPNSLWVANGTPNVPEFTQNTLRRQAGLADVPPVKAIASTEFVSPQDTLFDSDNDLWVVDGGTGGDTPTGAAVYEFTEAQLKALPKGSSMPTPSFTISDLGGPQAFVFPQFAAFNQGNLFVSDSGAGVIFMFTAMQLASSTGVGLTPAATFTSTGFNGPLGLAFDTDNNLWVANNGDASLVKVAAADLSGATGMTPITSFLATFTANTATPPSLDAPWGLAFDANKNLWVTNEEPAVVSPGVGQGTLVEFNAATVAGATGTSSPTPEVVITPTPVSDSASIFDPSGVAIDFQNNLVAIANAEGSSLSEYKLNGIASGSPLPNVFVPGTATTGLDAPAGLIVGPVF